jgi:hypothetical protein
VPRTVVPSKKFIVPVGVPISEETITFRAMELWTRAGFVDDVMTIAGTAWLTTIVRETGVAAAKLLSPGWVAVTVTVPAPVRLKVLPVSVAGPVTANATGSPEVAVAERTIGALPKVTGEEGATKLIV